MDLENRISLLVELGEFMLSDDASWKAAKNRTFQHKVGLFRISLNRRSSKSFSSSFNGSVLEAWEKGYEIPRGRKSPKKSGLLWLEIFRWLDFMIFSAAS